jgi:hypothetical protein
MRQRLATAMVPLLALTAHACTATPAPPVAVMADAGELGALAGEWTGTYWSAATGRRGVIRFQLQADTGAAWGDVWMSPADVSRGPSGEVGHGGGAAQPLQIRFVRVDDADTVSGTIEPYTDPECDCMLSTTFVGKIDGGRIEGTYTSRGGTAHAVTSGQWEAQRRAGTAPE